MWNRVKAGSVGVLAVAGLLGFSAVSRADAQELSDKSVTVLMDYAWSLVPAQFSQPDGKVIVTDKKKKTDSVVPIDTAKDVIKVGRLSAHAQVCNLPEDQLKNHRTLMKREEDKKKWSPQQMLYINQLHLVTVMLLTGKVKVTDGKDGQKEVSIQGEQAQAQSCSDEEKAKVKSLIETYVAAAAPAPADAAPVAAAAPAAPAPEAK